MPVTRKDLLAHIRIAGYHDDYKAGVRLFCENRISKPAYDAAFREGRQAKASGMACSCRACTKAALSKPPEE